MLEDVLDGDYANTEFDCLIQVIDVVTGVTDICDVGNSGGEDADEVGFIWSCLADVVIAGDDKCRRDLTEFGEELDGELETGRLNLELAVKDITCDADGERTTLT
jgi:hypothetical protein